MRGREKGEGRRGKEAKEKGDWKSRRSESRSRRKRAEAFDVNEIKGSKREIQFRALQ